MQHATASFFVQYTEGIGGLAKDWTLALKHFEEAAEQGHAIAMTNIGCLYKKGGYGLSADYTLAVSWYIYSAISIRLIIIS